MRRRGGGFGPPAWWQGGAERLGELASVLRRDFMIRRLKSDVLPQLPAKRRQVVRLEKPTRKDFEYAEHTAWQVLPCSVSSFVACLCHICTVVHAWEPVNSCGHYSHLAGVC